MHNWQGDIVGIVDSAGNEVVKYIYDPWGKILSTSGSLASTLGTIQPFRYRGYVYDEETGLYYLRSRYYHPALNRFLNADTIVVSNLYQYCNCSPIVFGDSDGYEPNYLGEIHSKVQEEICMKAIELEDVFIDKEVRIDFIYPAEYAQHVGHTYGYADLYNPETGEVWEIKPRNWSHERAVEQLNDYVKGIVHRGSLPGAAPLCIGKKHKYLTGEFSYQSKSGKTFDISYWYEGDGIIKYKYKERKQKEQTKAPSSEIGLSALWSLVAFSIFYATLGTIQRPVY